MFPKGSHDSNWDIGWIAGCIMFQFLAGIREFCLLQNVHTKSGAYLASYLMTTGGSSCGGQGGQPGCEVDDSHPVPRLRLCQAIAPLPHMPSWYILGQIY